MSEMLVLMPVYNSFNDALISLRSISECSVVNVLIINDGSKEVYDVNVFQSLAGLNVEIIDLEANVGITKALNYGLKAANSRGYKYVARLDAGDLCRKGRFKKQLDFLNIYSDVALVGSWVDFIDEEGNKLFTLKHPTDDKKIKKDIYRYNPFVHPAVMYRLDAIMNVGGYPDRYPALEDWACFLNVVHKYKVANLPEVLLDYVVSPNSISTKKRFLQSKSKVKLLLDNYRFNLNQTIGLIKSISIMILPRAPLTKIKKIIMR